MDYAKEVTALRNAQEWFRPKQGSYKIVCLGEATSQTQEFLEGNGEKKLVEQIVFPIETNGKQMLWSVTKSITKSGLYGQIITLGANNKNKLTGVVFDLIVKNDGKKNDYTIPQALSAN